MAIRRTDFLSCGNLDKTPMKNELSSIGSSILLRAWEKIKEAILCLPLFMFIVQYKKSIESFAHSWHSPGNFLESKNRNVVVS